MKVNIWSVALCRLSHPPVFFSISVLLFSYNPDGVIVMLPSSFYGDKEWAVSLVWFTFHHYHSLTHSNMHSYTLLLWQIPKNMKCENCECAKRTTLNIHTNKFDVTLWLGTYPSRPKTGVSILNLTLNRFPKPLKSNLSPFPTFPTSRLSSRSQTWWPAVPVRPYQTCSSLSLHLFVDLVHLWPELLNRLTTRLTKGKVNNTDAAFP